MEALSARGQSSISALEPHSQCWPAAMSLARRPKQASSPPRWGLSFPFLGRRPSTFPSKRLHLSSPPLHSHASKRRHRQASDLTQALSLTNLPLIFSLYVLRCDPCRASAPLADTPGSPPPGTRSTPLQPPARSLDPLRSIQSIPRSQSSLVSQRPAVCDPPCGSFLTSSSARSHLDLFTSPSSPPSKFKSLVDR
ncbi:hypothetical protein BHE90_002597 [Fusarium euwallaceae]|uniref:Uncharacterized protein n=2 Tax=Fusarium solani species complex TaxID=232080 RepID=A0A430M4C2_9HYPO|nr:hypothetical protein CEP51_002192 [Fusarium floridanum]RTE82826.1 hypothetical protein BHE90_002597 [Fusarium euwallaceae]